jgi:hypothetical protein
MVTLYPDGQNETTIDHELAHALELVMTNDSGHGAGMRSILQTILKGEGLTDFALMVDLFAPPSSAWTKAERSIRATISVNGIIVQTCY